MASLNQCPIPSSHPEGSATPRSPFYYLPSLPTPSPSIAHTKAKSPTHLWGFSLPKSLSGPSTAMLDSQEEATRPSNLCRPPSPSLPFPSMLFFSASFPPTGSRVAISSLQASCHSPQNSCPPFLCPGPQTQATGQAPIPTCLHIESSSALTALLQPRSRTHRLGLTTSPHPCPHNPLPNEKPPSPSPHYVWIK